jgi:hypothetical protein
MSCSTPNGVELSHEERVLEGHEERVLEGQEERVLESHGK